MEDCWQQVIGTERRISEWHPAIPHADSNSKANSPDYQGDKPDWDYKKEDCWQQVIGIGRWILGWHPAIPHANSNSKAEHPDYQADEPDWEYMKRHSCQ